MSYYNAYGVILMAAVFCVLSVLTDKEIEKKGIFKGKFRIDLPGREYMAVQIKRVK